MADVQTRPCRDCDGSGEEYDHNATGGYVTDCRWCKGTGEVPYVGTKKPAPAPLAEPAALPPPDPGTPPPAGVA